VAWRLRNSKSANARLSPYSQAQDPLLVLYRQALFPAAGKALAKARHLSVGILPFANRSRRQIQPGRGWRRRRSPRERRNEIALKWLKQPRTKRDGNACHHKKTQQLSTYTPRSGRRSQIKSRHATIFQFTDYPSVPCGRSGRPIRTSSKSSLLQMDFLSCASLTSIAKVSVELALR
jgi:hypothetical protein